MNLDVWGHVIKADIAEKIHSTTGLLKKDSLEMLEAVLSVMKSTLETGEKIKIAGFGNFEIRWEVGSSLEI